MRPYPRLALSLLAALVAAPTSAVAADPLPPAPPARADTSMPRPARVVLETLGGLGGAAVGGLLGYGLGRVAYPSGDFAGLAAMFVGGIPGLTIGLPTGIYLTGEACGGDGNFWGTLGGVAAGAVLPAIITYATAGDDPSDALMLALWITLPTAGGVLGYELTQADPSDPQAGVHLWVTPVQGGVFAGLGGTF